MKGLLLFLLINPTQGFAGDPEYLNKSKEISLKGGSAHVPTTAEKKKHSELECLNHLMVELEGVEPSSKQGNHTLSTCLFQTSFS